MNNAANHRPASGAHPTPRRQPINRVLACDPAHLARLLPGEYRLECENCGTGRRHDETVGVTVDATGAAVAHCFRCGAVATYRPTQGAAMSHTFFNRATPPRITQRAKFTRLNDDGKRLWDRCRPLSGTDGAAYLLARRCALPPDDSAIRFHPCLKHGPSGESGPALVALVTNIETGEPQTLHRTWVKADGRKADLSPPRLLLGGHTKQGGVIRLWPDDAVTSGLAVGEGIETCLSLAHAFTPVWALIDAGNLAALPVLPGVESLLIARDRDPAGEKAAHDCAARWVAAGAAVRLTAQAANDINDVLQGVAA